MTSVGYGEVAPQSLGGKLTIVLGAIVGGSVITCLLRVVLIDALLLSPQETLVLDVVAFHGFARRQKVAAAFLIQQAWHWHRERQTTKRTNRYKHRVYAAAETLRLVRFTQPSTGRSHATVSSSAVVVASSDSSGGFFAKHAGMTTQLEALQEQLTTRQRRSLVEMQSTAQLLRNIADTSRA